MDVTDFLEDGIRYREVVYKRYERLKQLKEAYEALGHRAWINPFDEEKWILTIEMEVN